MSNEIMFLAGTLIPLVLVAQFFILLGVVCFWLHWVVGIFYISAILLVLGVMISETIVELKRKQDK